MIERIKKILTSKGMSPSQFADEIEVQRSSLSHVLSGRNKPSLDFVIKIKQKFDDIDLEWLIFGEGEMYLNDRKSSQEAGIVSDAEVMEQEATHQQELEFDKPLSDNPQINESDGTKAVADKDSKVIFNKANKVIVLYANGTYEEFSKTQ